MSGTGKDDKPSKDYWKTGDPTLRAKVISSIGVAIVVLSIIGLSSFEPIGFEKFSGKNQPQQQPEPPSTGPAPPEPEGPSPVQPAAQSRGPGLLLGLLFIIGVILAIIGLVSYLRRRKKVIH